MFEVSGSVYCVVETADRNVSGSSSASWSRTRYSVSGLTDFVLYCALIDVG